MYRWLLHSRVAWHFERLTPNSSLSSSPTCLALVHSTDRPSGIWTSRVAFFGRRTNSADIFSYAIFFSVRSTKDMLSKITIGNRTFLTKKAAKMHLRDIRESGFVCEDDSEALQAFFKVSRPVTSQYNAEMHQYELWSGEKRLSVMKAIDYAFAGDDSEEITRILRAAACTTARNAVFWEGSKRRAHLAANPVCVQCGTDQKLEADHLEHCQFITLWNAYCALNPAYDEESWKEYHESRVEYQTLCKSCHRGITTARLASHSTQEGALLRAPPCDPEPPCQPETVSNTSPP